MTILLKLKFILSILLFSCLFLPLSQCATDPKPGMSLPTKELVQNQYVFKSPVEIGSWLNSLALLAPVIVLLLTRKSRHKIKNSLVLLLLGFSAFYVVFSVTFFSEKILLGGYIAYISSTLLILLALVELYLNWRGFRKINSA